MHTMFQSTYFPPILILSYLFDLYTMALAATFMLKRKYNKIITMLSVLAGWYICLFPLHFDNPPQWTNSILILMYLVWPIVMFKDSFIKKLLNGILSAFVCLFADLNASLIVLIIFGSDFLDPTKDFCKLIYYILIPIYYFVFVIIWNKSVNKKRLSPHKMLPFWVFTAGEIGVILSLTFIYTLVWDLLSSRLKYFLFSLIVMFIIMFIVFEIIIFYATKKSEKFQKLQADYKVLEYQNQLQSEYYEKIQENIDATAKIRHDINNIVNIIKIQLAENTAESRKKAAELTNEIYKIMASTNTKRHCENRIVNTVLFDKENSANSAGIKLCDEVILNETTNIENFDLCRLFVNLLDNSINALKNYSGDSPKTIFISCKESKGFVYIKTENPYISITDLHKKRSDGYGLKIIEDIANKYGGTLITKAENGKFKILVTLKSA